MNLATFYAYLKLIRLDKPTGFFLLLLPALLTLAYLNSLKSQITLIIILGAFCTRSLGCILNDMADREIDRHVQRTTLRPLSSGELSITQAAKLALIFAIISLYLASFIPSKNFLWIVLCASLITVYPLAKRFFMIPQIILGLTFAQCVPLTTLLLEQELTKQIALLYSAVCLWVIAFDTVYAMADYKDDQKLKIYTAIKALGVKGAKIFALSTHLLAQVIIIFLALDNALKVSTLIALCASMFIMIEIFKKTYQLTNLSQGTQIFHLHLMQGLAWILVFIVKNFS